MNEFLDGKETPRLGLLIQGPMMSVGVSGVTVLPSKKERYHSDDLRNFYVRYDCNPNVISVLKNYRGLFSEVVLSTWENEVISENVVNSGITIVQSKELNRLNVSRHFSRKKRFRKFRKMASGLGIDSPDAYRQVFTSNVLRQFYGSFEGIKAFENVTHVVRIRSDQSLDLELLRNSMDFDSNKIYVTYIAKGLVQLHDFYFAGKYNLLREYFCILSTGINVKDVHSNCILRYMHQKYRNKIKVHEGFYFAKHSTFESLKIANYAVNHVFESFPFEVFKSVEWRGGKIADNPDHCHYADKIINNKISEFEETGRIRRKPVMAKLELFFTYQPYGMPNVKKALLEMLRFWVRIQLALFSKLLLKH